MSDMSDWGSGVDLVVSFDTTGSMYPALKEVRRRVSSFVADLFATVPDLRIGVIAHGDYCDRNITYITKHLPLVNRADKVIEFVNSVDRTGGGDSPECYELVLYESATLTNWRPHARKALVMIGDEVPHEKGYTRFGAKGLDYGLGLDLLRQKEISVFAVQALGRRHADWFYTEIAQVNNGHRITLSQFNILPELLSALVYKQAGDSYLANYEKQLIAGKGLNRALAGIIDQLMGRETSTASAIFGTVDLEAVDPGRFQVLHIDIDTAIKGFVLATGAEFVKGAGFYQWTKTETIQEKKKVVLVDQVTGDMFSGDKARDMIGLPTGERGRLRPGHNPVPGYDVFIQSTSYNRKLKAGTQFLYEVTL